MALLVVVMIAYVDRVNVSILVLDPDFLRYYGIGGDRARQGLLMTVFLLGYGASAIAFTPLMETFLGCRRGLVASVACWAVLTAVSPLTTSLAVMLLARCLLGVGEGPLFSLKVMFVGERFSANDRGKPNAVSSMGVSLGLAIGYPVVTSLLKAFGWRWSFETLAAANLLIGLPLVLAFVRLPDRAASGTSSQVSVKATLAGAMGTRDLGLILLVEVFTLAYLWGSSFWLPAYLQHDRHVSLANVGWLAALPFVIGLGANLLGGIFVDMLDRAHLPAMFVVGGALCAASIFALVMSMDARITYFFLLAASFAWGLQSAAIPTLIQNNAPAGSIGSAYGVINGIGNIVAALMPLAMGSLMKTSVASGFSLLILSQVGVAVCGATLLLKEMLPRRALATPSA